MTRKMIIMSLIALLLDPIGYNSQIIINFNTCSIFPYRPLPKINAKIGGAWYACLTEDNKKVGVASIEVPRFVLCNFTLD